MTDGAQCLAADTPDDDHASPRSAVGLVATVVVVVMVGYATHLQAAINPLTGLLNRRSCENKVRDLLRHRTAFTLAVFRADEGGRRDPGRSR